MGDGGDTPKLVPRLCHIVRWSDFNGYGFNLHAEKGKAGQYIGKVDEGSPAEAAGLKQGDRIVEVNGVNIGVENHQQVVGRIKAGGEETRLLVVDAETDQLYKDEKKVVKGDLPEVLFLTAVRGGQAETANFAPTSLQNDANGDATAPQPDESDLYRPRLCNLCKWPDFDGYGFNLHAEKDKPGQYIGSVDPNSPAETGGLRENDRIIEVNGENIESQTHSTVIAKIKSRGDQTQMLVVDKATDEYYKGRGQTVSSSMSNVMVFSTPSRSSDVEVDQQQSVVMANVPDFKPEGDDDEDRFANADTLPEPNVSLSDEEPDKVEAEVSQVVESAPVVAEENLNGTDEEAVAVVDADDVAAAVEAVAVDDDVATNRQEEEEEGQADLSAYEQVEVTHTQYDAQDGQPHAAASKTREQVHSNSFRRLKEEELTRKREVVPDNLLRQMRVTEATSLDAQVDIAVAVAAAPASVVISSEDGVTKDDAKADDVAKDDTKTDDVAKDDTKTDDVAKDDTKTDGVTASENGEVKVEDAKAEEITKPSDEDAAKVEVKVTENENVAAHGDAEPARIEEVSATAVQDVEIVAKVEAGAEDAGKDKEQKKEEEEKEEEKKEEEKKEEEPPAVKNGEKEKTEETTPGEEPAVEAKAETPVAAAPVSDNKEAEDATPPNGTTEAEERSSEVTAPEVAKPEEKMAQQEEVRPQQQQINGTSNGINGGTEDRTPEPEPVPVPEPVSEPVQRTPEPEPEPAVIRSTTSQAAGDLNLNLSAAEMKERLKSRRKQDPRMQKQSFEQKHKMFEKL